MLILSDVSKSYEGAAGAALVLDGVSLGVGPGQSAAIVGPSGSGKSTLLNIIGSLDKPTSGAVKLGEIDVTSLEGRRSPSSAQSRWVLSFRTITFCHSLPRSRTFFCRAWHPAIRQARGSRDGSSGCDGGCLEGRFISEQDVRR